LAGDTLVCFGRDDANFADDVGITWCISLSPVGYMDFGGPDLDLDPAVWVVRSRMDNSGGFPQTKFDPARN
jgi:hypothetical protein